MYSVGCCQVLLKPAMQFFFSVNCGKDYPRIAFSNPSYTDSTPDTVFHWMELYFMGYTWIL
jgi:hypothetical protein